MIKNDTFILDTMADSSISGIFVDCLDRPCPAGRGCASRHIHTDFFAIRTSAVSLDAILATNEGNAELMAMKAFSEIVKKPGRRLAARHWATRWPMQSDWGSFPSCARPSGFFLCCMKAQLNTAPCNGTGNMGGLVGCAHVGCPGQRWSRVFWTQTENTRWNKILRGRHRRRVGGGEGGAKPKRIG